MTDLLAAVRQLQERREQLLAVPFGPDSQWEQEAREALDLVGPLIEDWGRLRYEIEETIHDLAVPSTHTAKGAASRLSAALALPGGEE